MMFKDSLGREWTARVDAETIVRIEAALEVDFFALGATEGGLAAALPTATRRLRFIYECFGGKPTGVAFGDFLKGIDTADVMYKAFEAAIRAFVAFFPETKVEEVTEGEAGRPTNGPTSSDSPPPQESSPGVSPFGS